MLTDALHTAERVAREAGRILQRHFSHLHRQQIHTKAKAELVTDIDRQVNRLIIRRLLAKYKNHGILAEEGGNRPAPSGYRWIIDPLDGTTNYVTHVPYFGVSIALTVNGNPILGVVNAPETNECFTAIVGQGARLNGRPISVSSVKTLKNSMVAVSYGSSRTAITRAVEITRRLRFAAHHLRHNGSAALDLAYVAAGRLDAAIMAGRIHPWDVAAGVVIVREAGGQVSDLNGQPLNWASTALLASNFHLHRALLRKLA